MAINIVDIPYLSPLKFQLKDYANPAPYNTKYSDDWAYPFTIPDFYDKPGYCQPFQKNDIIFLQLLSNFGVHNVELLTCDGIQIDTFEFAHVPSSIEGTGQKVFQLAAALNTYPEGVYKIRITSGAPVLYVYESELFDLRTLHANSVQIKYKHDENDFQTVFETGIEFIFRTFGGFPPEQYKPGNDTTVFIDQSRNGIVLARKTYDIDKFLLGDAGGVPREIIQKMNDILGCSSNIFDGKQYVVNDGADFNVVNQDLYPMAGWGIDLRPADNARRKRFQADGNSNNPTTVIYNLDNSDQDMFGTLTGPASDSILHVESLD